MKFQLRSGCKEEQQLRFLQPLVLTASKCGLFSKPSSATFAIYMVGFKVIKPKPRTNLRSSSDKSAARAGLPSSSKGWIFF